MPARKPRRASGSRSRSSTAAGTDRRTDDLSVASLLTGGPIRLARLAVPADTEAVASASAHRQVPADTATVLRDRLGVGGGGSRSSQIPGAMRKPRPHRWLKLVSGAAGALALTATFCLFVFGRDLRPLPAGPAAVMISLPSPEAVETLAAAEQPASEQELVWLKISVNESAPS